MPNFNLELAILTSIILGFILAFLNIGGIFSLAIVGFVAVYLTNDEEASYKVGSMAAGALCLIYFFICLFTPPDLPYQLPNPVVIGISYGIEGLFTLILGLIVGLCIYGFMGAIGGYFADKIFKPQDRPKRPVTVKSPRKILKSKSKPKRRTLNRKL
ncbi:MAG: hypothetical protein HVN35_07335 [Methanobacteriaceae archaeon]|nr:hypothetical protein [Methanobacteriaceae archaeon]